MGSPGGLRGIILSPLTLQTIHILHLGPPENSVWEKISYSGL